MSPKNIGLNFSNRHPQHTSQGSTPAHPKPAPAQPLLSSLIHNAPHELLQKSLSYLSTFDHRRVRTIAKTLSQAASKEIKHFCVPDKEAFKAFFKTFGENDICSLDAHCLDLEGTELAVLENCRIKKLNLSENHTGSKVISYIKTIRNLTHLQLQNNNLTAEDVSLLFSKEKPIQLVELDISGNNLWSDFSNEMSMPTLLKLSIKDDSISHDNLKKLLSQNAQLQQLDLSSNQFDHGLAQLLGHLHELTSLDLSDSELSSQETYLILKNFSDKKLKHLNISGAELFENFRGSLPTNRCLETLILNNTNISVSNLEKIIKSHPNLQHLDVSHNPQAFNSRRSLQNIRGCEKLKSLSLAYNGLDCSELEILFQGNPFTSMETLDISENSLRNASRPLPKIESLLSIDIIKTDLNSGEATDQVDKFLRNNQHIKQLNASLSSFLGVGTISSLSAFENLETVQFCGHNGNITDYNNFSEIARLPNLRNLAFNHIALSSVPQGSFVSTYHTPFDTDFEAFIQTPSKLEYLVLKNCDLSHSSLTAILAKPTIRKLDLRLMDILSVLMQRMLSEALEAVEPDPDSVRAPSLSQGERPRYDFVLFNPPPRTGSLPSLQPNELDRTMVWDVAR